MVTQVLSAILLPLAAWGLLASMMFELIALRGYFIVGGEEKLQVATVAFALALVLVQRLVVQQGASVARAYGYALGGAMLLFSLVHPYQWSIPGVPPFLIFGVNVVLFGLLWWAGHKLTAACGADDQRAEYAGDRGILSRASSRRDDPAEPLDEELPPPLERPSEPAPEEEAPLGPVDLQSVYGEYQQAVLRKRQARREQRRLEQARSGKGREGRDDDLWRERLAGPHPGRGLLYFALVALPLFGLDALLAHEEPVAQIRTGIRLFIYLWCALTLLWLAGLGQLRAYFYRRRLEFPEEAGMAWIGLGTVCVILAVVMAFVLPHPESAGSIYVQHRLLAAYHGWESEYGRLEAGKRALEHHDAQRGQEQREDEGSLRDGLEAQRQTIVERTGDEYLAEIATAAGPGGEQGRLGNAEKLSAILFDSFVDLLRIVLIVTIGMKVLVVIYGIIARGLQLTAMMGQALHRRRVSGGPGLSPASRRSTGPIRSESNCSTATHSSAGSGRKRSPTAPDTACRVPPV